MTSKGRALGRSLWRRAQSLAGRAGVYLDRRCILPFGLDWTTDVAALDREGVESVLDVGANVGRTAAAIRRQFPRARVVCFEPFPSTFELLRSAMRSDPMVRCENVAISDEPGQLRMAGTPGAGTSRIVDGGGVDALASVPAERLDDACARLGIERVDILKVDVEGSDMRVLRGAEGTIRLRGVRFILMECEFSPREGEPHARFEDIHAHLVPMGFSVVSFYTGGVDNLGWRWGNVLYQRVTAREPGSVRVSPYASVHARVETRARGTIEA